LGISYKYQETYKTMEVLTVILVIVMIAITASQFSNEPELPSPRN